MLRYAVITLLVASLSLTVANPPTFVIRGPTIVAFFPPVTDAGLEKNPDTNETLSDFQLYAARVREPLQKAGIDFQQAYTKYFRVRVGSRVTTFRPKEIDVGYYYVAPGKKARVEYGVATDLDILQIAHDYFGVAFHDGTGFGSLAGTGSFTLR